MDLTDFTTSWAPLLLSLAVVIERVWSRANDKLQQQVDDIQVKVNQLEAHQHRQQGANIGDRLTQVERRQRDDETALVRVDQRLQSADQTLAQLLAMLQSGS